MEIASNSQPFSTPGQLGVPVRFLEEPAPARSAPGSYWLLLAFLLLLYANLPMVWPALDAFRPAKIVAVGAMAMLFIETMMGRRSVSLTWPEGYMLAGFLAAGALSCFTALWMRQAADSLSDLVKMSLVYFFIANCANTERRLRGVIWTLLIGGLIPAAGTLRNYLDGNLVEGRAAWVGIFANPNELAYSLIVLIPLAAVLASGLSVFSRLALLGIVAVYMAAIFVTFSRGGMVGLAVVGGLYGWRKRSVWIRGLLLLVAVAGMVAASRYWSRSEDFTHLGGDVSFRQRLATSAVGLAIFADHPLSGVGLGCSVIAWPLYAPKDLYSRTALVTHNSVIQPLAETGILGFITYALFIGLAIRYARRLALETPLTGMGHLGMGMEIALWGFVACGLSGGYILTWFPYILVGLVSAARRIQEESQ
jgi:O-antigen ligase